MSKVETVGVVAKLCLQAYIQGQTDIVDNIIEVIDIANLPFINKEMLIDLKHKLLETQKPEELTKSFMEFYKQTRNIT